MKDVLKELLIGVGEIIKNIREEKKLTLEDIEFRTGINASDLSRIEQGKSNITFKTFAKILSALDEQPEIFFNFKLKSISTDKN